MTDERAEALSWRCLFCRMKTGVRLFGIPVCDICRDQVQDFIWVSGIQGTLAVVGLINGFQFVVEEVLLLAVLVVIKHRLPSIFDGFIRTS